MERLTRAPSTWYAIDPAGNDLRTGRPPAPPGAPSPAAALAAAPVAVWPATTVAEDGRRFPLASTLGPGGQSVEALVGALVTGTKRSPPALAELARATPCGPVDLPVDLTGVEEAAACAGDVERGWLVRLDRLRAQARDQLVASGRGAELEAAVHVTMLLATERLDPADDTDVASHMASGAQLWLLGAAVAWALAAPATGRPSPFAAWAELVARGWWPVGPVGGRLIVAAPAPAAA